jgi:hypothetical protein
MTPTPRWQFPMKSIALIALASSAAAQEVNPANLHGADKPPPPEQDLHSWELPPTVVTSPSWSPLRESDLVGEYGQPRWSTKRLFATTRTYVIPAGQFEFEYWTRVETPRNGPSTLTTQYEFEVGLPGRLQLDVYFATEKVGSEGEANTSEQKFEMRYALADWGKIPWNPTLYAEYASVSNGSDKIETKLLLADEVSPGWKVGANLSFEREITNDLSNEYMVTLGVSRAVIDEKLSIGGEMRAIYTDTHDNRGDFKKELEIGPSLQWRAVPAMHLDIVPLIGIGADSQVLDLFLVLGWEF